MHWLFDILAGITLLFFFLTGWHQGFVVSILRIASVATSYAGAILVVKYLGGPIADILHLPRIIAYPMVALLTYITITLVFSLLIHQVMIRQWEKEEKNEFHLSVTSSFWGGVVSLTAGMVILIVAFWVYDTFRIAAFGQHFPDASSSCFGNFSRKVILQTAYAAIPKQENKREQAEKIARLISEPSHSIKKVEAALNDPTFQQLFFDQRFREDFLSGDANRISTNEMFQAFFKNRSTLEKLQDLGMLSPADTPEMLAQKLTAISKKMQARFADPQIQNYIAWLQRDDMFSRENIHLLPRDRRFLLILDRLLAD